MTFKNCTPVFPVADMADATRWFVDHLGFEAVVATEVVSYLQRDGAAIRLIPAVPELDLESADAQTSCYIDVEDVDGIFEQHKDRLMSLRDGYIRPPFNQYYGQREFHVIYANILILVGMPAPKDT